VSQQTLQDRFKDISQKLEKATADDPVISILVSALFALFENQNNQLQSQSNQLQSQNITIANLSKTIEDQKILIEKLNYAIAKLTAKLGDKSITVRKTSDENINGKGSEKKKGINSSSGEKKAVSPRKAVKVNSDISTSERYVCIDINGEEISVEDARKKIGTTFVWKDGKRYKYVRINDSSVKADIDVSIVKTHYSKLQIVAVDDNGNELADVKVPVTVCPETDFLKKSLMSIGLMCLVLEQWFCLKAPLNRISQYLLRYGIEYSRQQLYSYTNTTAALLMPVFKHMESYLREAKLIGVDETYWSCRERQKLKDAKDDAPDRKSQRSKSKTLRSYVFGIVSDKLCLYYHSLQRNADIPKMILLDNQVSSDCFIESDAFYRKMFSIKVEENGHQTRVFWHGLCWVHARRNFCELINYSTHKDGRLVVEIITNHWEQDVEDSRFLRDAITECFKVYNEQVQKCMKNPKLDICELKHKHVKPLIDDIFAKAYGIYETIKKNKENPPKRECSNRLYKAVVYLINNESRLRTFLDNPYGVMTNNATEEKFRELDLLRNGMMASDTCKGAENLTEFYSLYKTCMLHNVDFRSYMMKCITTMTLHMDKIEFEKDKRGTVTGYKAHHITSDVLDKLMPWNMA
jgi:uncharacterized coiled-coil protein SlyX